MTRPARGGAAAPAAKSERLSTETPMSIHVKLFAAFREIVGTGELDFPTEQARTVGELWGRLLARHPDLNAHVPSAAVNRMYAPFDQPLRAGDEVAFLPPVSGG